VAASATKSLAEGKSVDQTVKSEVYDASGAAIAETILTNNPVTQKALESLKPYSRPGVSQDTLDFINGD